MSGSVSSFGLASLQDQGQRSGGRGSTRVGQGSRQKLIYFFLWSYKLYGDAVGGKCDGGTPIIGPSEWNLSARFSPTWTRDRSKRDQKTAGPPSGKTPGVLDALIPIPRLDLTPGGGTNRDRRYPEFLNTVVTGITNINVADCING